MKKLTVKDKNACKACLQCEISCSEAFYKQYDKDLSCIRITASPKDANTPKINVCIQCGKCAKACEHEAISQNAKGVYVIDKKKCVGCFKCVEACPCGVMVKAEGATTPSKCIACGICVKNCPMQILEIVEK